MSSPRIAISPPLRSTWETHTGGVSRSLWKKKSLFHQPFAPSGSRHSSRQEKSIALSGNSGPGCQLPRGQAPGSLSVFPPARSGHCLQSHAFYCRTCGETKLAKAPLAETPAGHSENQLSVSQPGTTRLPRKHVSEHVTATWPKDIASQYVSSAHLSCLIFSSFFF